MKILLLLVPFIFSVSCSKKTKPNGLKSPNKKEQAISFSSPLRYVVDESLFATQNIAQYEDITISRTHLSLRDPALTELAKKHFQLWTATAVQYALSQNQDSEKITIQLPFPQPKESLESLMTPMGGQKAKLSLNFSEEASTSTTTQINGKEITLTELSQSDLNFSRHLKRYFEMRLRKIEEKISQKILKKQAEKLGLNLNEYIKQKVYDSSGVTDQEAKQYAMDNNIPEKSIDSEMLTRLKSIVYGKQRNEKVLEHAALLTKGQSIRVGMPNPTLKLSALTTPEGAPSKGSGPVAVVLLSHSLCQQCKAIEKGMTQFVDKNLEKLNYSYLFTLQKSDRKARFIAEAALCVNQIDSGKFWSFQKAMLAPDFVGDEDQINNIVAEIGIDTSSFRNCQFARESKLTLESQLQWANTMGALKAPIAFINGEVYENIHSMHALEMALEYAVSNVEGHGKPTAKTGWWAWLKSLFS